ncbi:MAG: oligosaccharide flippase family protein [Candidatus Pacearchaeota archaeon]
MPRKDNKQSSAKAKFSRNVFTKLLMLIVAAIASYAFYFIVARILSVEEYGLLYSLIALTYLFTVPHETIRAVIARYTVELVAKKKEGQIKGFFLAAVKNIFWYSFIVFIIFLIFLPLLTGLFHASMLNMLIIGTSLLVAFLLPIIWGILQGTQSFGHLGINNSIEGIVKLIIAVGLILLGLGVNGALISVPLSITIAFFAGLWPIRKILRKKTEKFKGDKKIIKYSIAAFIIFLLFVALYSVDVILARYFLSARLSGLYGSISMMSKTVLFVAITITRVMFSAVAEQSQKKIRENKKEMRYERQILFTAGIYVMIVISIFLAAAIFVPELYITIFVGTQYLDAAPYLKYMIIAMGLLSLSSLIIFYNLSVDWNKKLIARTLGAFLFLQIALIILFHRNLQQFANILMITNTLLFIALLIILFFINPPESIIAKQQKDKG